MQTDGNVVADETCQRIQWLIHRILEEIGTDATGWDHLYSDPETGSLWELTYPHSDWHGGGPPALSRVSSAVCPGVTGKTELICIDLDVIDFAR